MTKWTYAHAIYRNGIIDSHIEMSDMSGNNRSLGPFLHEAGEKGWELCGVLPYPTSQPTTGPAEWAVIFKRPASKQPPHFSAPASADTAQSGLPSAEAAKRSFDGRLQTEVFPGGGSETRRDLIDR
jgi:hypothetical protein